MGPLSFIIRNFAKVSQADINLRGLTVVVGENNSGKSTIGKSLFALCSVFGNLDERVYESKLLSIDEALDHASIPLAPMMTDRRFKDRLLVEDFSTAQVVALLKKNAPYLFSNEDHAIEHFLKSQIASFLREVSRIKKITPAQYREAVVWDYFDKVFHSQIIPVFSADKRASLEVVNGGKVKVSFDSTSVLIERMGQPSFKVCYINGPVVANLLNSDCALDALEVYDRELTEGLRAAHSASTENVGVVGARKVANRIKLKTLRRLFERVMPGNIVRKDKGKLSLSTPSGEPISFENLSSGLKSFVLLWQVLDQGLVSDGDVLILDEPEVHLHPEWQIVYAEIIVLAAKLFDLRILLTSHSVDFIHAISLFVRKYSMKGRLSLYKSVVLKNGSANMEPVAGNDWEKLFETFVRPIDVLTEIAEGLPEEIDGE